MSWAEELKKRVLLQLFKCYKNTRHGAGNRTRTCTPEAVEPKSTESTNSTMPASAQPECRLVAILSRNIPSVKALKST